METEKYQRDHLWLLMIAFHYGIAPIQTRPPKNCGVPCTSRANKGYRVLRFLLTNVLNSPECFAHCFCETIKNGKEAISIVTALKTLAKSSASRI